MSPLVSPRTGLLFRYPAMACSFTRPAEREATRGSPWFDRSGKRTGVLGDRQLRRREPLAGWNEGCRKQRWRQPWRLALRCQSWLSYPADVRCCFRKIPRLVARWEPYLISSSKRNGHFDLYEKVSSGAGIEQSVLEFDADTYATSWSPDGQFILYHTQ